MRIYLSGAITGTDDYMERFKFMVPNSPNDCE